MVNIDPRHRDASPPATSAPTLRRRGRAVAPVARVDPGRVAAASHRNPVWLLAGVLLVLGSAVGGMVLFRASDQRHEVLVAGHELAAGEVVDRDDFRIRRVAAEGLEIVGPDAVDGIVGQRAIGPIPAGALIHPGMFTARAPIGPDEMDVGAALDPGAFPRRDLALGAATELLAVAEPVAGGDDPAVTAGDGLGAVVPIGRGTIVAVEERANGQLLVSVRVERAIGLRVAQAAAEGRLRLALVSDVVEAD